MQTSTQEQLFNSEMKKHGLRVTVTKREVFTALAETKQPLSIQNLVSACPGSHHVSIYRSIEALLKAGIVKQVPQGFKNLFELSDVFTPHHHHVSCEVCGSSKEVHSERVEKLMEELTVEAGLTPTKHHFEMYGICANCQQKSA